VFIWAHYWTYFQPHDSNSFNTYFNGSPPIPSFLNWSFTSDSTTETLYEFLISIMRVIFCDCLKFFLFYCFKQFRYKLEIINLHILQYSNSNLFPHS
jgi:hypothetical protein